MSQERSEAVEGGGIKPQEWAIVDPGADVVDAEGEKIGSVRESMPGYLQVKVRHNLLTDVEIYVPRTMITRIDHNTIYLNQSKSSLDELDLTTAPTEREST